MAVQIQIRRGTAAEWTSADPVLADGELGLETDTAKVKIGDGSTSWTSLDYRIGGDLLPDQTGNAGKVLTTDGSTVSWQEQSSSLHPFLTGCL